MSRTSSVAVVLAGFAVVLAATGTAVAVTASHVLISDPVTKSRSARVDTSGRLTTVGATGAYSYSSLLGNVNAQNNFVTTPTKASLAITAVSLSSPSLLAGTPDTEVRIVLYKATSSSATSCVPTVYKQLSAWNVAPGDDIEADLAVPFLVKPTGTKPYCLSLFVFVTNGGAYGASYYPYGTVSWYVAGGTYSGPRVAAKELSPAQVRRQAARRGDR